MAIIGHSGSGKSTLMNMLGCLDIPTAGKYYLDGKDVLSMTDNELSETRNRTIGFIFQGFNLIQNLDAIGNVELPLIYRGIDRKTRRLVSKKALCMVGLEKRMKHRAVPDVRGPAAKSCGGQGNSGQATGDSGQMSLPATWTLILLPRLSRY